MAEGPIPKPKDKSLKGFYVAMGVLFVLAAGGWFAWTPFWIRYYVGEFEKSRPIVTNADQEKAKRAWDRAANGLVSMGPSAGPAVRKLLSTDGCVGASFLIANMGSSEDAWCLPYLAELIERDSEMTFLALFSVNNITGNQFLNMATLRKAQSSQKKELELDRARTAFLDWWEREGKAKYGSSR